jgi:uncharacterized membrane protein YoaK (UPF0700 family)
LHTQKWRGRIGLSLVALLSVLAGMTDAIGFMASGDFVSFMSGNTTRMAVAISAGDAGLTLRLALLVATFIVGNALGIIVSRLGGRRALPLLLIIAALLCAAATWPLIHSCQPCSRPLLPWACSTPPWKRSMVCRWA